MKKLINDKERFLSDMLDGLKHRDPAIEVIEGTVVVRKDRKKKGVALVSGGGSGHEPAHAGYVAQGMLDAAVCGEVFTSPTPDKVLSAIKAVDNGDGVLLVIKNYSGDVMNFEMAQEMAEAEGYRVASVVVRDDVAIDNEEQRRGVAGTVLVHKYAGYLAEQGVPLDDIVKKVQEMMTSLYSIGMALHPCLVPTTGEYGFDLSEDEMEIGIGIHGEKGISREKSETVDKIVDRLLDELFKYTDTSQMILMINGMGATPESELSIVTKYVMEAMDQRGLKVSKLLVGDYMTALDMQGFSLTVLDGEDEVITAIEADTGSKYF
ncbi:dihydroxyacetone kinase subunit DhaK [Salinicoccus roseus]|uniref:dihydroxyacetone kinase subunit DhaK n=1 Tax=Salinicoccus roseus TaxID=45670 RepID=UPI000F4EE7ED|nr:dihydroxyacetone kinase subunit DhaK [Salinicoccus roseus]RPE51076.1 dihydroxyacetone kinase DhaK subunit [Salinicoccus roseus]GGA78195.1 dihydroxyacetone kinase subunit DhaK [Salinicoccus roseus]